MKRYEQVEREVVKNMRELDNDEIRKGPTQPWRKDSARPIPVNFGFYQPTGNRKLDAILANARPPIQYGGSESAVATFRHNEDEDGFVPRGKSWIIQPSAEAFTNEADRRAVLVHELIHWTKERGRAQRHVTGWTDAERAQGKIPPGYAQEELTAEIGTALVLDAIGEDPQYRRRAAYCANWMCGSFTGYRAGAEALAQAMVDAERAADYLLKFCDEVA